MAQQQDFRVKRGLHVSELANVVGNTVIGGTLSANGAASLANTLSVTGAATLSNTIAVTGAATLSNTIGITGATSLSNTISVTGAATLSNTADITGATSLSNTISVTGAATLSNNASVGGTLGVTRAATFSNTISVTGAATLSSSANITGAVVMSNTLSVTGATTLSNNASVGGTLGVTGAATLSNTLSVTGATALSNTLSVTGSVTLGNSVTISGNLTVSGTTTYVNTATLNVSDNIVTLNADWLPAAAPTESAGLEINRGSAANAVILWDESNDRWTATGNNAVVGEVHVGGTGATNVSSTNAGGSVLQDIALTFDKFGHVTGITKSTANVDNRYLSFGTVVAGNSSQANVVADVYNDTITFANSTAIDITTNANTDTITFTHSDTSSVANVSVDNSGLNFLQDVTLSFDGMGHVTNASFTTANIAGALDTRYNSFAIVRSFNTGNTFNVTTTINSAVVTVGGTSNAQTLAAGVGLVGSMFPIGATVATVSNTSTFTMSANAIATTTNAVARVAQYQANLVADAYNDSIYIQAAGGVSVVSDPDNEILSLTGTTYALSSAANTIGNEGILSLTDSNSLVANTKIVGQGAAIVSSNTSGLYVNAAVFAVNSISSNTSYAPRIRLSSGVTATNSEVLFAGSGSVVVSSNASHIIIDSSVVDSISNTSATLGAAANSVKRAYDTAISANSNADTRLTKADPTVTSGNLNITNVSHVVFGSNITFSNSTSAGLFSMYPNGHISTSVSTFTLSASAAQNIIINGTERFRANTTQLGLNANTYVTGNLGTSGSANVGTTLGVGTSANVGTTLGVGTSANVGTTLGVGGVLTVAANVVAQANIHVTGVVRANNVVADGSLTLSANQSLILGSNGYARVSVYANGMANVNGGLFTYANGTSQLISTPPTGDSTTRIATTEFVVKNASKPNITYVTKAGYNSLLVLADGILYSTSGKNSSWGSHTTGRGINAYTNSWGVDMLKQVPLPLPSTNPVIDCGGGYSNFAYALDSQGRLYMWGLNGQGQCAIGSTAAVGTPRLVAGYDTSSTSTSNLKTYGGVPVYVTRVFTHPSNGGYSIAANRVVIEVADQPPGTTPSWYRYFGTGDNAYGVFGTSAAANDLADKTTWTELGINTYSTVRTTNYGTGGVAWRNVPGFQRAEIFNLGASYGAIFVQVTSSDPNYDKRLYVAGYNGYGQLGDTTTVAKYVFVDVTTRWITDWSTSTKWTVAQMTTGSGGYDTAPEPDASSAGTATFMLLRNTSNHTRMMAAGYNAEGYLGIGNTTQQTSPQVVNINGVGTQTTASYIKQIAVAGGRWMHVMALLATGELYAWGRNDNGQLGVGTVTDVLTPTRSSAGLPNGTSTFVDEILHDGNSTNTNQYMTNSFAKVIVDGVKRLYGCGRNDYGQLGVGDDAVTYPSWTRVLLPLNTEVKLFGSFSGVNAGFTHVFITQDNTLYACGYNGVSGITFAGTADGVVPQQFMIVRGELN